MVGDGAAGGEGAVPGEVETALADAPFEDMTFIVPPPVVAASVVADGAGIDALMPVGLDEAESVALSAAPGITTTAGFTSAGSGVRLHAAAAATTPSAAANQRHEGWRRPNCN